MANTYTLINSTSLSSSAASVTFSSIPATYDDLCLIVSARSDRAGSVVDAVAIRLNSDTSTIYSNTNLTGNGSAAASSQNTGYNYVLPINSSTGSTATSSTFGSVEIYFPSYRVSQHKPIGSFGVQETNATTANLGVSANLYRSNTAISTILVLPENGSNWVSGSTFWLYGIKNS